MALEYRPGRFADVATTELGRRLWAVLNEDTLVQAMEVASDLGHPAVAGIEEALLSKFGKAVLEDRIKQMIGHMVRQVMERHGFVVDQQDVKVNSIPFAKATRYRRPEWSTLHVFRSSADPRELCFTQSRSGQGLPELTQAKWRYWSNVSTSLRCEIAFGIDSAALREEVIQEGFARRRLERLLRAAN